MTREVELALRRERLLVRSAALREVLAQQSTALERPLAVVDNVQNGLRWLRDHPLWPVGGVLLGLVLRPRRVLRWGLGLWTGWRSLRRLRGWIDRLA